jgi:diacylglycerol kinase (ATP)
MEKIRRYGFGLIFFVLGAGLFSFALKQNGFPHAAALSAAICFALLAIAYFFSWPGLLGKRRDGRLLFSSYALFWPYHLSNYLLLAASRLLLRERPFDEIAPGLFIGARLLPFDRAPCGFQSVLDLTCEFSEMPPLRNVAAYLCIPLLDRGTPSQPQLRAGLDFIGKRLEAGPV